MRLHLRSLVIFLGLSAAGAAWADGNDQAKPVEMVPGQASPRAAKLRSPQAQLFVEQKDAPAASKTSVRFENAPRLSSKSKD